jgi:16S rRNA (uracil1498-N3)-methyltransferase
LSLKDLTAFSSPEVEFMVGPEGGFTSLEVSSALEKGYAPLLMGPRILRTETAALAFIAAIQTRFGDF